MVARQSKSFLPGVTANRRRSRPAMAAEFLRGRRYLSVGQLHDTTELVGRHLSSMVSEVVDAE